MPIVDLSFNNPRIRDFFERKPGVKEVPSDFPVGEMLYIHTHILDDDFLSQLQVMINMASLQLATSPKKKGIAIKLVSKTEALGKVIHLMNEENAPEILEILRDIYRICKQILGDLPHEPNY